MMQVRDPLEIKLGSLGDELSLRQLWKSRIEKSEQSFFCYLCLKNMKLNLDVISLIVPLIHLALIWETELANMAMEELPHDYIELLAKKLGLLQSLCLMQILVPLDSPLQAIYLPQTLSSLENVFRFREANSTALDSRRRHDVYAMSLRTCRSILDYAHDCLLNKSLDLSLLCLKSVRPIAGATMSRRSLALPYTDHAWERKMDLALALMLRSAFLLAFRIRSLYGYDSAKLIECFGGHFLDRVNEFCFSVFHLEAATTDLEESAFTEILLCLGAVAAFRSREKVVRSPSLLEIMHKACDSLRACHRQRKPVNVDHLEALAPLFATLLQLYLEDSNYAFLKDLAEFFMISFRSLSSDSAKSATQAKENVGRLAWLVVEREHVIPSSFVLRTPNGPMYLTLYLESKGIDLVRRASEWLSTTTNRCDVNCSAEQILADFRNARTQREEADLNKTRK